MKKNGLSTLLNDTEGYVSIPLWEQEDNKSTYYDHWLDVQGVISERSMEEAEKAFEKKYCIKL
ncbi:hypothetical protein D7X48_10735 [bacterium D16-50]|nr:hypothetical protein D7X48_10735 [bacterium D16-50]